MRYRLNVRGFPFHFALPHLNDALLKAKAAFEQNLRVEYLEFPDGHRLGPEQVKKLICECREELAGWPRLV